MAEEYTAGTEENGRQIARNSAFELCRILIMLMIVVDHFAVHGGFSFPEHEISVNRLWLGLLSMGGNFGVDVFVLISGYYLVRSEHLSLRKILMLWGQLVFYSVLISAVRCGTDGFSAELISKTLFPISSGSWWFATTYLELYLLHPFLNRLLCRMTKHEYRIFLLLTGFVWCVLPTFTPARVDKNPLIEFIIMYCISGYIRIFGSGKNDSGFYFSRWIIMTALVYFTYAVTLCFSGGGTNSCRKRDAFLWQEQSDVVAWSGVLFSGI